jgi:putative SOS response-associated peptidase YedK
MCTRFLLERGAAEAGFKKLGLDALAAAVAKAIDRFNIAPGTELLALRVGERPGTARAFAPRWGFRSARAAEDGAPLLVNARAETLAQKPTFREALRRRRCLVPATGFYEWEKRGRARLPWLFRRADGGPFAFAALWEPVGENTAALVLVTTEANALLSPIHDRMPALLPSAEACRAWLNPRTDDPTLGKLLAPRPADELTATPVSPRVNQPDFDSPECVRPSVHGLAARSRDDDGGLELPLQPDAS